MSPPARKRARYGHFIVAALIVGLSAAGHAGPAGGDPLVASLSAAGGLVLPDWMADGGQPVAELGYWVAGAGDVNGDGAGEIIAGAILYDGGETNGGRALVWHGSAAGLPGTFTWSAEADQAGASLGIAVAGAGDVNGDGFDDVLVGAYTYSNGEFQEGRAYLFAGSPAGVASAPLWVGEGGQAGAQFGIAVAGAGDVNADGFDDIVVGANLYDDGGNDDGRAFLYLGSPAGPSPLPDWFVGGDQDFAECGYAVASAGDVNGDGYGDVVVGTRNHTSTANREGRAALYLGGPSGLATAPAWFVDGGEAEATLGHSVGSAGDVDGDGFDDLLVGAPFHDSGARDGGRALLFHGGPSGPAAGPAWWVDGDRAEGRLGFAVAGIGDLNGDGYSDIAIGRPFGVLLREERGEVLVFLGGPAGLSPSPDAIAVSDQPGALFGRTVDGAGDVNGDGFDDLVTGARYHDGALLDEGRVYVYHGASCGLRAAWFPDDDGDGWGRSDGAVPACLPPPAHVPDPGDCDDDDAARFPGNAEVCDAKDNDCDGADETVVMGVQASGAGSGTLLSWPAAMSGGTFDVVRGGLRTLLDSGGDFAQATGDCLAAGLPALSVTDPDPPEPGDGFWYLVRPRVCGGEGSYESQAPSQVGLRDPEILASPARCP